VERYPASNLRDVMMTVFDCLLPPSHTTPTSLPNAYIFRTAQFAKLKALTQDEALLRKALVDSTIVSIQDNKIKANIKPPGRSTIILREIPSDAPQAEVEEIFKYPGAKTFTSIRSEIGDTWFVTMDTEEDAKDTLLDLRLKKRTFRGASVKARLKTETVVRSFFPVNASPVAPFSGIMAPVDMRAFGYMGVPVAVVGGEDAAVEASPSVSPVPADTRASPGKAATTTAAPAAAVAAGTTPAKKGAAAAKGAAASSTNASGRRQDNSAGASGAAGSSNARSGAKGGNAHKEGKKEEVVPRATIEINVANFPPLGGGEDLPVPTPGYKGPFQKYNADEIINIAKGVKETNLPATLKPSAHPLSMTVEANKDLLKRQRSFSIDETREQLRQGRPVMKDAVLPGKVDSRSLYYGDEAPATTAAPAAKKEAAPAAPANTTPSQAKKVVKEVPATPVAAPASTEATTAATEVVDHVAAAAANLAITSPTASESAHMPSPQKITPSTWAAMLKSSASAAAEMPLPAATRAPVKETKRAPAAKEAAAGASKTPVKAAKGDAAAKEASTEGRNRRKNSETSREGRPATAKEGKEKDTASSNGSVTATNGRRKAEPGTPSRGTNSVS